MQKIGPEKMLIFGHSGPEKSIQPALMKQFCKYTYKCKCCNLFLVCSSASWAQILQLLLSTLLFEARNGTKIGHDFVVSRVLKSPQNVLIFYPDI